MKTLSELYEEVMKSDELKAQFVEAAKEKKIIEFCAANGVETSEEELKAFAEAKLGEQKELSLDELENAAGGKCNNTTTLEAVLSTVTVGIWCGVATAISASGYYDKNSPDKKSYLGQKDPDEGRICSIMEI